MDFINQVKKLKEITKSPEVKALCENFINGGQVSKDELMASINENAASIQQESTTPNIQSHIDSIRKEEADVSKKYAESLMESWGGLNGRKSSYNSGSYNGKAESENFIKNEETKLFENIANLDSSDQSTKSFVSSQGVKNLGVLEAIEKIKGSSIYTYPKAKIVCEQYQNLILNKNVKEYSLVHNFIAELESFSWDDSAKEITESLREKATLLSREIEIAKVLEAIKNSGSASFYSDLTETLNQWLVSESKSNGLLVKNISQWSFNPIVRGLVNFLNIDESQDNRRLEIPVTANGESSVNRVYSPIIFENGSTLFYVNGCVFEATSKEFGKVPASVVSKLPKEYTSLIESFNKPYVKVNENGVYVQLGKKIVRLVEENGTVSVYLGKDKLRFGDANGLAKLIGFESSAYYGVNETEAVGTIMNLYQNFENIVELDFAKSVNSKIYEGVAVNLFKWNDQIYVQKVNEGMKENSLFKVSGSQAVAMVKDYMRYDISEGLTEFLEGESKIKSVMVNDRNKVLENINRVETEINKLNSVMGSNPMYGESKEIKAAHSMLENELVVLREKWNQINSEIKKSDENIELERIPDLFEDEKFNLGDFIKVKESGETGKIISIDGNSGRYTILLDSGKTADHYVNEISDLAEALDKASEKNAETNPDGDDSDNEVKESNNFNKSEYSIDDQKKILKKLADGHGFSNAPKSETNEEIEMELDSVHGYNLTMNEAKAKAAIKGKGNDTFEDAPGDSKLNKGKVNKDGNLGVAPGNKEKAKGKVVGKDGLEEAPDDSNEETEFNGEDAVGEVDGIGYNLKESAESDEVKKN